MSTFLIDTTSTKPDRNHARVPGASVANPIVRFSDISATEAIVNREKLGIPRHGKPQTGWLRYRSSWIRPSSEGDGP